jgi:putative ABC transport system substrate-binding protein
LRDAGLVEDRDFTIDYRSADEQYDRLPGLAAELVQRRVTVLAAPGGMALAAAARDATSTIPILFMIGSDPLELGLVKSFSRPGVNLTGVAYFNVEVSGQAARASVCVCDTLKPPPSGSPAMVAISSSRDCLRSS